MGCGCGCGISSITININIRSNWIVGNVKGEEPKKKEGGVGAMEGLWG